MSSLSLHLRQAFSAPCPIWLTVRLPALPFTSRGVCQAEGFKRTAMESVDDKVVVRGNNPLHNYLILVYGASRPSYATSGGPALTAASADECSKLRGLRQAVELHSNDGCVEIGAHEEGDKEDRKEVVVFGRIFLTRALLCVRVRLGETCISITGS